MLLTLVTINYPVHQVNKGRLFVKAYFIISQYVLGLQLRMYFINDSRYNVKLAYLQNILNVTNVV